MSNPQYDLVQDTEFGISEWEAGSLLSDREAEVLMSELGNVTPPNMKVMEDPVFREFIMADFHLTLGNGDEFTLRRRCEELWEQMPNATHDKVIKLRGMFECLKTSYTNRLTERVRDLVVNGQCGPTINFLLNFSERYPNKVWCELASQTWEKLAEYYPDLQEIADAFKELAEETK